MAQKYLVDLDLNRNELRNARIQNLATAPSSPVAGQQYYDTSLGKFGVYNGSTWDYMGTSEASGDVSSNTATSVDGELALFSGTGGKTIRRATSTGIPKLQSGQLQVATAGTDYYAPGSTDVAVADGGTGASTAAAARTNLGLVIGTDVLAPNGSGAALTGITQGQITNLTTDLAAKAPSASPTFTGTVTVPTPSNATDAANKLYVDNAVQGLSWKQAARVATTANITLSGTQTIDGVAVVANDRVLVKNQTTASANGIYVVAAGAWSRASDADTSAEIVSATLYVEAGTANADTVWSLTNDTVTLGTTSLTFAQINGGATPVASTTTQGKVELATTAETEAKTDTARAVTPASLTSFTRKVTGTMGDGALTSIPITHNLGSQFVTAQVYEVATNALIECDVVLTSTTAVTFGFSTAPATNALRYVIVG